MRSILQIAGLLVITVAVGVLAQDTTSTPATEPSDFPATQPVHEHGHHSGGSKFYGVISAVDSAAKTFVVNDQTYTITGDTALTKATDGSTATLADVTVGQTARGSFHKAEDGTLNVTKMRLGKKSGGGKHGGKKHDTTQPDNASN
jgi:Domain of unknown function (DUF5666)